MPLTFDSINTGIEPGDCAPGEACALVLLGGEELSDLDIAITDADLSGGAYVSPAAALPASSNSSSSCPAAVERGFTPFEDKRRLPPKPGCRIQRFTKGMKFQAWYLGAVPFKSKHCSWDLDVAQPLSSPEAVRKFVEDWCWEQYAVEFGEGIATLARAVQLDLARAK